jgi:hypothetical protein
MLMTRHALPKWSTLSKATKADNAEKPNILKETDNVTMISMPRLV